MANSPIIIPTFSKSLLGKIQPSILKKLRLNILAPVKYWVFNYESEWGGLTDNGNTVIGRFPYTTSPGTGAWYSGKPYSSVYAACMALQPYIISSPLPNFSTLKGELYPNYLQPNLYLTDPPSFVTPPNSNISDIAASGWTSGTYTSECNVGCCVAVNESPVALPYWIYHWQVCDDVFAYEDAFGSGFNLNNIADGTYTYQILDIDSSGWLPSGGVMGTNLGSNSYDVEIPFPTTDPNSFTEIGGSILNTDYYIPVVGIDPKSFLKLTGLTLRTTTVTNSD